MTALLSEGLAASDLEAGCPDSREPGGQTAATLPQGPGTVSRGARLCRRPLPDSLLCPGRVRVCVWPVASLSLRWEEAPPAGLWGGLAGPGGGRRRASSWRHQLHPQAGSRGTGKRKDWWPKEGPSGPPRPPPACWRAQTPPLPRALLGVSAEGAHGSRGRLHEAGAWQPSTVPAAPSADESVMGFKCCPSRRSRSPLPPAQRQPSASCSCRAGGQSCLLPVWPSLEEPGCQGHSAQIQARAPGLWLWQGIGVWGESSLSSGLEVASAPYQGRSWACEHPLALVSVYPVSVTPVNWSGDRKSGATGEAAVWPGGLGLPLTQAQVCGQHLWARPSASKWGSGPAMPLLGPGVWAPLRGLGTHLDRDKATQRVRRPCLLLAPPA